MVVFSLILNTLGTVLVFFYGIQPGLTKPLHQFMTNDFVDPNPKYKIYKLMAYMGFTFIIIGNMIQLYVATLII